MIGFHETLAGRKFFEYQLPQLIKAIDRLADAVEEANTQRHLSENKTTILYECDNETCVFNNSNGFCTIPYLEGREPIQTDDGCNDWKEDLR